MRLLKSTALAMAFISPAIAQAATDGTPGATSTGTFNATATVNPPIVTQVQVFGLDDFAFAPIQSGSVSGGGQTQSDLFCLARNTPGNVLVTIRQFGKGPNERFQLVEDFTGFPVTITSVEIQSPSSGALASFPYSTHTNTVQVSGNGCSASSDGMVANKMIIKIPQTADFTTTYPRSVIARFEISVAPQ